MSIVAKSGESGHILFTKGADEVVFSKVALNNVEMSSVKDINDQFASLGLRTLVMAKKKLEMV